MHLHFGLRFSPSLLWHQSFIHSYLSAHHPRPSPFQIPLTRHAHPPFTTTSPPQHRRTHSRNGRRHNIRHVGAGSEEILPDEGGIDAVGLGHVNVHLVVEVRADRVSVNDEGGLGETGGGWGADRVSVSGSSLSRRGTGLRGTK